MPDSLRATYRYTEGLKRASIYGDSAAARALYEQALAFDSEFAPALYEMASQYLEKDGAAPSNMPAAHTLRIPQAAGTPAYTLRR